MYISVSLAKPIFLHLGGGGAEGPPFAPPPPPHNAFSEFCRFIWKFVGTWDPASMSFVPTKYWKK